MNIRDRKLRKGHIHELTVTEKATIAWKGRPFLLFKQEVDIATNNHYLLLCYSRKDASVDLRFVIGSKRTVQETAHLFKKIMLQNGVDSLDCAYWPMSEVLQLFTLLPA